MKKVICNPINMSYPTRMDQTRSAGLGIGAPPIPHRGSGDTTVVRFKGRYYMFGSLDGFWYSDDLQTWEHKSGNGLGIMRGAAGDVCEIDGYLYHSASSRTETTITRSPDPMNVPFEVVSKPVGAWDPCMFLDDDGRVYFYWGCSNVDPIYGVELDRETFMPIGEVQELFEGHPDQHGWERNGWNNDRNLGFLRVGETDAPGLDYDWPWIEGPYMNKHDGKYYLQYAGPATELPFYSDGYYVADSPLGPFTYSDNSPFSNRISGFYPGCGHGSSFEDEYGNWWHATTMIGANGLAATRKMGIWPVGFDKDGIMYTDQNYGDYPHYLPDGKEDPNNTFTGWMLLSYNKPVKASSELPDHPAKFLVDETCRTYYAASVRKPGEWVMIDLEKEMDVRAIQVNLTDHDLPGLFSIAYIRWTVLPPEQQLIRQRWLLEGSKDGENWEIICDKREADTNMTHDLVVMEEGKTFRYIRLTSYEVPFFNSFACMGLRVFGHANGEKPAKTVDVKANRCPQDQCHVEFSWAKAEGADGYNVRWGIAPDKLYHSTMVYGAESLVMNNLNDGVPYFVQIDAFNGSGITEGDVVEVK